jgi:hypothetical protein
MATIKLSNSKIHLVSESEEAKSSEVKAVRKEPEKRERATK